MSDRASADRDLDPALEKDPGGDPLAILDDYDFVLPEANIAQAPEPEREAARLLVLDRESGQILTSAPDHRIKDPPSWLRPGDLVVVNATRVLPARLVGRKSTGGAAEALLLGPALSEDGEVEASKYRALLKCTGRVREGIEISFGPKLELGAEIVALHERGEVTLAFDAGMDPYDHGEPPLPPYIQRAARHDVQEGDPEATTDDRDRYQTVYARDPGAIAAPTAGLHFTESLFERLRAGGVEIAEVVLHVGAGTFRPLDAAAMRSGRLHSERFELPAQTRDAIARTRDAGGRVVAIGTTTARVLESQADDQGQLRIGRGTTDLFLRPGGAPFRVVDALLTNFHLPRSSLLLLVAAFVGREPLLAAYEQAIGAGFRFYSYGDAMLILSQNTQAEGP